MHADPLEVALPPAAPTWATKALQMLGAVGTLTAVDEQEAIISGLRQTISEESYSSGSADLHSAVLLSVLCDLALQGWRVLVEGHRVTLHKPRELADRMLEKERVKRAHRVERDRQLAEPSSRAFIGAMEEARLYGGEWVSVFSLMRDGREFSDELRRVRDREASALKRIVDPYLQFISGDETCEHTGLRLADIWRYFRMTWTSAYQSTPGRRMHILVRDRAARHHTVIGIAALSSAVVQLSVRDDWIGWTPEATIRRLEAHGGVEDAQHLLESLQNAIQAVFVDDLVSEGLLLPSELTSPTQATIRRLSGEAKRARIAHEENPQARANDAWTADPASADWKAVAMTPLFRSKRASALADLLQTVLDFRASGFTEATLSHLKSALASPVGKRAIARLVRTMKSQRVGIDLLDITTCGAIAPYGPVLGGKLVSLLMMSPEVAQEYNRRYADSVSLIASAMSGQLVKRPPQLVFLGTTSLYHVGSSQYNRLKVPAGAVEGATGDMGFFEIGMTKGFGSFHFSDLSVDLGDRLTRQRKDRRRVNSIFGEGVNPRLRKLREALTNVALPPEEVMVHGSPRVVYAVPLASNFRDVLLGRSKAAAYFLPHASSSAGTEALANFWRVRWLRNRVSQDAVLLDVARHSLERPIRHGARVVVPASEGELPLFRDV